MKYFKPKSLTWWFGGVVPLGAAVILATEPLHGLTGIVSSIDALTGGIEPSIMVVYGMTAIGFRGAIA